MWEFLGSPIPQIVIWGTAVLVVCLISFYLLKNLRERQDTSDLGPSDLLTDFREMHDGGGISEKEYQTIKSVLADKFQNALKDDDQAEQT